MFLDGCVRNSVFGELLQASGATISCIPIAVATVRSVAGTRQMRCDATNSFIDLIFAVVRLLATINAVLGTCVERSGVGGEARTHGKI